MFGEDASRPPGLVGLANLGNTCYMNAALQCLINTPALADFFLRCPAHVQSKKEDDEGQVRVSMAKAFAKLILDAQSQKGGYIAPLSVLHALKSARPAFRGFQQHDSQEFLRCFMDLLHEDLMEPARDHQEDDQDSEGEEEEEPKPRRRLRGRDSLASSNSGSGAASPLPTSGSDEEYETADSGVSDDAGSDESQESNQHGTRKRRHSNHDLSLTAVASGDNAQRKRERDDAESTADTGLGDSEAVNAVIPATSSASDIELEFTDALTSASPSPAPSPRGKKYLTTSARSTPQKAKTKRALRSKPAKVYRSVVTDIFDGKLISSVQCLSCNRVSSTAETFQDLSLPIPTAETLAALRAPSTTSQESDLLEADAGAGWLAWAFGWLSSWFYGPDIGLVDCLSHFFSADELKGDNMYSCERCSKLRNGLKYARVTVLPDTLCIHLKRFRHDFAFSSSKVSTRVTFPLVDLDMAPWMAPKSQYREQETLYDLTGVICHHGGAGGGHYTAYALNPGDEEWYEFDDSVVTGVEAAQVASAEAYVLFYRFDSRWQ